jgi:hypothetical protein
MLSGKWQHFKGICCIYLQGTLKKTGSATMLVTTTRLQSVILQKPQSKSSQPGKFKISCNVYSSSQGPLYFTFCSNPKQLWCLYLTENTCFTLPTTSWRIKWWFYFKTHKPSFLVILENSRSGVGVGEDVHVCVRARVKLIRSVCPLWGISLKLVTTRKKCK